MRQITEEQVERFENDPVWQEMVAVMNEGLVRLDLLIHNTDVEKTVEHGRLRGEEIAVKEIMALPKKMPEISKEVIEQEQINEEGESHE